MRTIFVLLGFSLLLAPLSTARAGDLRAGCYRVDVTPRQLPAIMNGGFLEKTSSRIDDPLFVRSLVLSAGRETVAIAVVDSCMMPRDLCDAAKNLVRQETGIPADHILIAATHTHSAPSVMSYTLGTRKDSAYAAQLVPSIAESIREAHLRRKPAKVGWAVVDAPHHTHCRRWIRRPEAAAEDPFGEMTVRAMMHPGYQNPEYVMPAGPVDSALTLLSVQTANGLPMCALANYSMHYFGGTQGFSADYFGDFCSYVEKQFGATSGAEDGGEFLAIMSQGTSGDLHWMDYSQPKRVDYSRKQFATELGELAVQALHGISYRSDVELAIAQAELRLKRRLPSARRLAWAKAVNTQRGERRPKNRPEVYAEQAAWLTEHPTANLILQAIRIGDIAIATLPNEVYGITGLKLKSQSPITLMNFELANGAEGYIPPPEQHYLGGYTTWPARTAGLEASAEPQIVASLIDLLEEVTGGQRKPLKGSLYTEQQQQFLRQAETDDNNRENRAEDR